MPAPTPLKKHTSVVERLMKEEEYYFKDYYGNDAAQIEKAKAAIEDKELEGNRESMMDQTTRAQQETLITYHTLFEDNKIADATEKLREELEKTEEREGDEAMEKEIKIAKEVIEKAQKLIDGGARLPKGEEKK